MTVSLTGGSVLPRTVAGALTLVALLPAPLTAQGQTFSACYVPQVGAMYLIKLSGLPAGCLSANHVEISWTEGSLGDGAVTTAKLADGAVITVKLADGAVTLAKLATAAVGSAQIADGAVSAADLAPAAVGTTHLADGSVTSAKLASDVGSTILGEGSVTTSKLADGAVTSAKLADASIGTAQIADGSVTAPKLGPGVGGVSDHGALTGLADDDHPQYLLVSGARALTGAINAGGNKVTGLAAATASGDAVRFEQAVKPGDAAAGDLAGTYPNPGVAALRGRAVSATAPTANQVLAWSGTTWEPATPTTGVTDHGDLSGLPDDDHAQYLLVNGTRTATDGFAVTGTLNSGVIPVQGAGTRFMWYPRKAALRAGEVFGMEWDDPNVGSHSIAAGNNTVASGAFSIAIGDRATATGSNSAAVGTETIASGDFSIAIGNRATASGFVSSAMGNGATASALSALALGNHTTARGFASTAMGHQSTAAYEYATAMGLLTLASGSASTATGNRTRATGWSSTAMGENTAAQAFASVVIGQYNVVGGDQTNWVPSDPLLVAGNGTLTTPSNALTLLKNGDLTIAGSLTQSSDRRLKEDIQPINGVLERVLALTPIRYRFQEGTGRPREPRLGLTAQDIAPLFPELVRQHADGYLSVAYTDLSAVLVRAIQEQQAEIEALWADNAALRELFGEARRDELKIEVGTHKTRVPQGRH